MTLFSRLTLRLRPRCLLKKPAFPPGAYVTAAGAPYVTETFVPYVTET